MGNPTDKKKEPGRFSIKFNARDPAHQAVIERLNRQSPRGKAQFIANAVLYYIHCSETPDITQPMQVDSNAIEKIVLNILKQQNIMPPSPMRIQIPENENPSPPTLSPSPDSGNIALSNITTDSASLSAIADTLAAFRRQ